MNALKQNDRCKNSGIILHMGRKEKHTLLSLVIVLALGVIITFAPQFFASAALDNPLGNGTGPIAIITRIIKFVLGFVGVIALINFIIAGIQFLTSSGNPEKTGKATQNMLWTVIGLAILFTSGILVNVVLDIIGNTTK